jgi:hypothetical protein
MDGWMDGYMDGLDDGYSGWMDGRSAVNGYEYALMTMPGLLANTPRYLLVFTTHNAFNPSVRNIKAHPSTSLTVGTYYNLWGGFRTT